MEQSPGAVIGRVVGVFAIVGLGLGVGALLFLWSTDFFKPSGEDFGSAIVGGLALGAVLVFALLSGVVVAAMGGLHAANTVGSRGGAIATGLVAGLIGHIVMVAAVGGLLIAGFEVFSPQENESPATEETQSPVDPECAEMFGEDSAICRAGDDAEKTPSEAPEEDEGIDVEQLMKLALGAIPAGLVGGLTAATLFSGGKDY